MGGASQLLQQEEKWLKEQQEFHHEVHQEVFQEEQQEEQREKDDSCVFDADSLSSHIAGKTVAGDTDAPERREISPACLSHLSVSSPVLVSWRLVVDRLSVLFLRLLFSLQQLQHLLWWLLELHIVKIVSSYIIWVSVKEVRVHLSVCLPPVSLFYLSVLQTHDCLSGLSVSHLSASNFSCHPSQLPVSGSAPCAGVSL